MDTSKRSQFRLRIIGFLNIFFIFLGLTRVRIDFIAQRVIESRLAAVYVIFANIASLVGIPITYVYDAYEPSSEFDGILETFSDNVNVVFIFGAMAFTVLLRGQREGIHLEIAEKIIALDRRYFSKLHSKKATKNSAAYHLLYFKLFALALQVVVPFCDSLWGFDALYVGDVLPICYYSYVQSILAASLFLYFYLMWLLRQRFGLLNIEIKELLRQLQQLSIIVEQFPVKNVLQSLLVAEATANLVEISDIHACLTRLLVRLNADYKKLVVAVLLSNLIESISFGYYLTLAIDRSVEFRFDTEAILLLSYAAILFVDINLVYWISDMTMDAHGEMALVLQQFQILPPIGNGFEQQCELFALQLQQRKRSAKNASVFLLNRQSALTLWTFALTHIIVLIQFDLESRLNASAGNLLLNRFNDFFRIE